MYKYVFCTNLVPFTIKPNLITPYATTGVTGPLQIWNLSDQRVKYNEVMAHITQPFTAESALVASYDTCLFQLA